MYLTNRDTAITQLTEAAQRPELNAVFAALADPTRRAMLAMLASGKASVMELAAPFSISQPAVTKHLKVLERAHLVFRSKEAQRRPARVNPRKITEAMGWLESYRQIWEENFSRLDNVVEALERKKTGRKGGGNEHKDGGDDTERT